MRYAFVTENTVRFIDDGTVPLTLKYHQDILVDFKPVPEGLVVEVGDYFIDNVFSKPIPYTDYSQLIDENNTFKLEQEEQNSQIAYIGMMTEVI